MDVPYLYNDPPEIAYIYPKIFYLAGANPRVLGYFVLLSLGIQYSILSEATIIYYNCIFFSQQHSVAAAFRQLVEQHMKGEYSMKQETSQNRTEINFEENRCTSGYAANLHQDPIE